MSKKRIAGVKKFKGILWRNDYQDVPEDYISRAIGWDRMDGENFEMAHLFGYRTGLGATNRDILFAKALGITDSGDKKLFTLKEAALSRWDSSLVEDAIDTPSTYSDAMMMAEFGDTLLIYGASFDAVFLKTLYQYDGASVEPLGVLTPDASSATGAAQAGGLFASGHVRWYYGYKDTNGVYSPVDLDNPIDTYTYIDYHYIGHDHYNGVSLQNVPSTAEASVDKICLYRTPAVQKQEYLDIQKVYLHAEYVKSSSTITVTSGTDQELITKSEANLTKESFPTLGADANLTGGIHVDGDVVYAWGVPTKENQLYIGGYLVDGAFFSSLTYWYSLKTFNSAILKVMTVGRSKFVATKDGVYHVRLLADVGSIMHAQKILDMKIESAQHVDASAIGVAVHGTRYGQKVLYLIDDKGVTEVTPLFEWLLNNSENVVLNNGMLIASHLDSSDDGVCVSMDMKNVLAASAICTTGVYVLKVLEVNADYSSVAGQEGFPFLLLSDEKIYGKTTAYTQGLFLSSNYDPNVLETEELLGFMLWYTTTGSDTAIDVKIHHDGTTTTVYSAAGTNSFAIPEGVHNKVFVPCKADNPYLTEFAIEILPVAATDDLIIHSVLALVKSDAMPEIGGTP